MYTVVYNLMYAICIIAVHSYLTQGTSILKVFSSINKSMEDEGHKQIQSSRLLNRMVSHAQSCISSWIVFTWFFPFIVSVLLGYEITYLKSVVALEDLHVSTAVSF